MSLATPESTEICKDDYPQMLEELRSESFEDVLDVGCGTGAVLELLHGEYPEKHLTGLDLTPRMIEAAWRQAARKRLLRRRRRRSPAV